MGSPQTGFYSTPLFELFRRGLLVQTIQKFRGINAYTTLPQLGPEWAQDALNVVITGAGNLSKLRFPVKLTNPVPASPPITSGPNPFIDFQQANGTRQILAFFGQSVYFYSPDFQTATLIDKNSLNVGQWSLVIANNIAFGTNGQRVQKWTGTAWQAWGINGPPNPPTVTVVAGGLSPAFGYQYSYAGKNSITGHVGNRSPVSVTTGPQTSKGFQVVAQNVGIDPQVDTLVWFRSLDGGGDQFRLAEINLVNGAVTTFGAGASVFSFGIFGMVDNSPDLSLDQTVRGPLINNPPLVGNFVAVGQGRVFIFNLNGAPQDIIYSGYEQILVGRPEESFPSNNRLRLSIGAEEIAGGGVIQAGVVAFSRTGRMYMLRGAVEDITLNAPINFSSYLEELPWTLGCFAHPTIQSTPYGLIWLAGDKTVQLFDGHSEPIDISTTIYPLLRRITPGTESLAVAGYFNWLERDWYALVVAVDGALTTNRIFMFSANLVPDSSTIESIEVFVSDIPNNLPSPVNWIGTIATATKQRILCIGSGGFLYQLPVSSDTVNGITQDLTIIPATNNLLNGFWRGGYAGSDQPQRMKTWRFARLITDQNVASYKMSFRLVDDETRTLAQPEIIGPIQQTSPRFGINRKAKRCSVEINFPANDVASNVLELQIAHIPTSDR